MKLRPASVLSTVAAAVALLTLPPAAVWAATPAATPAAVPEGAVGQVSLVVGKAEAIAANGQRRLLERGSAVRVGERVETQAGGHVHIAFVDGGRVSVRPASRLHIEDYSRPAAQTAAGAIRFRLEEGVVRSITGQWGEEARDRFRLNTPLAAIGVKGTDFAVRSDGEKTAASVYTGAIVVAPLDAACAATVGVCANGQERLLTAGMKGQMLELSRSQTTPQFVPAVDLLAQSTRSALPDTRQASATRDGGGTASPVPSGGASSGAASAATPLTEALASAAATDAQRPPEVKQLAWIRPGAPLPGDALSVGFEQAMIGNRRATVGNLSYTLFTSAAPMVSLSTLAAAESVGTFRLAGGSATLMSSDGRSFEAANVTGGSLVLDFARAQFATQLGLASPTLGTDTLKATGGITKAGYFFSLTGNQLVAGAVTSDGKEAGYLFEKRVAPGVVRGITLWGR